MRHRTPTTVVTSRAATWMAGMLLGALLAVSPLHAQEGSEDGPGASTTSGWKTMPYRGVPIQITLKAGEESIFRFPWRVEMGTSGDMLDMVRMPSIGDSTYFTPIGEFARARFHAEDMDSGAVFLIDITSAADAVPQMLAFVDARAEDLPPPVVAAGEPSGAGERSRDVETGTHSLVALARFALHNIYAPERLIEPLPGVSEHRLGEPVTATDMIPGAVVHSTPIAEWITADGRYVTAIQLTNKSPYGIGLDPRNVRHTEQWVASAFWTTSLTASGSLGDTTTLVVIAETSWRERLPTTLASKER